MSLRGTLFDAMTVCLTFYVGCCAAGRADIPIRLVAEMRVKAMEGVGNTKSWGCPLISPDNGDCMTWRASNYK